MGLLFVIHFSKDLEAAAFCILDLPEKLQAVLSHRVAATGVALIAAVTLGLLLPIPIAGRRWKAESSNTSPRN